MDVVAGNAPCADPISPPAHRILVAVRVRAQRGDTASALPRAWVPESRPTRACVVEPGDKLELTDRDLLFTPALLLPRTDPRHPQEVGGRDGLDVDLG